MALLGVLGCGEEPRSGGDGGKIPADSLRIVVGGKTETHAIQYDFGDPWDTGDVVLGRTSEADLLLAFRRADDPEGYDARIVNVDLRNRETWTVRTQRGSRYLTSLATPRGTRFRSDTASESTVEYTLEDGEAYLHLSAVGGFVHEMVDERSLEVWDPEASLELELRIRIQELDAGHLYEQSISDRRFAGSIFYYEVGCDTCDLESLYNGGAIHLDDQGRGTDRVLTYHPPDEDVLWGAYADMDRDGGRSAGDYACDGTEDTQASCELIE